MKLQTHHPNTAPRKLPTLKKPDPPPPQEPQEPQNKLDFAFKTAFYGGIAHTVGSLYPTIYLHELGHKVAAHTLFDGVQSTITVNPLQGGSLRWRPQGLSELGQRLGYEGSRAAVAAAGPMVDVVTSMAAFGAGYKMRHRHPVVAQTMMGYAAANMANLTLYAGSGIGKTLASSPGHDFLNLQAFAGIPCWVSTAVLASLLPAQYLVMRALDQNIEGG